VASLHEPKGRQHEWNDPSRIDEEPLGSTSHIEKTDIYDGPGEPVAEATPDPPTEKAEHIPQVLNLF